jgi:hypothetical protein
MNFHPPNQSSSEKVRVEYVKSNLFRVSHVDGAFGGTSPRLELFISFYSERFPIPKVLTYEVSPAGMPGEEVIAERESKSGIIREVEAGVILDLPAARAFAVWLNDKVAELERAREAAFAAQSEETSK